MYKIRTIDVWDTLLRRDCHPECIKLATAQHLYLGWASQLKPEFCDGWTLYLARLDAELLLAEQSRMGGQDAEYEITKVMEQWICRVFSGSETTGLSEQLAEFEFSAEVARSYADHGILSFLRAHQAEKTMFLSDFYMRSEMLRRLLASKGLDELVTEGLSSCDVGFNKRSGQIFHHVHRLHAVKPDEHVHIGDNEWSDVSSPRALGINAIHYLPEPAHTERLMRERLFSSRDALFDHVRLECLDLTRDASEGLSSKHHAALNLGVQAAPLFIGFALWIAEQAITQKFDRLYFFTREGEFFYKVFSTLFPSNRWFGHDLPTADILAVSRLSTFASSMTHVSTQEMSRVWSLFKVQSISGLFVTLGLNIGEYSELLDTMDLKETDIISDPGRNPKICNLFKNPQFVKAVNNTLVCHSSLLKSYLNERGVQAGKKIGVIDIGWRGTIQDNIARLIPDSHFHGLYLGLRSLINTQSANVTKSAYGPDENISDERSTLFSNFAALELLCSSPKGSVMGYVTEEGCTTPRRQIDQNENAAYENFVESFQEGVLLAAKHWRLYLESYAVASQDLHTIAMQVWNTLRRTPGEELVEVYLRTPQQDVFGYGEIFKRSQYPSLSTIFLASILGARRHELIEYIRRVQWSEAIANAKDIGLFHRSVLLLVFRAANLFKVAGLKMKLTKRNKNV